MKRICFLAFFAFSIFVFGDKSYADTLNIDDLVFTSSEQTLTPTTISSELKVQTQNSGGTAESVSETNDVTFTSTSSSGEFLNSSGNAVSKTMSKNTSSRAFYYRDPSIGTFTLTVEIKGRDSGKVFSASQNILISNEITPTGTTTPTTTATTTPTTATTTPEVPTTLTPIISAHSSTVTITYVTSASELKVDAGRHRIATTKSPIQFEAEISGGDSASYNWSFGDGTGDTGKVVNHNYKFTGDYNVVLNVTSKGKSAVSRTEVKVIDPEVKIVNVQKGTDGFVELQNKSFYEINIENWKLVSGEAEMIFARDTIMKANSTVKFPFEFSLVDTSSVTLYYTNTTIADVFGGSISNDVVYDEPTREEIEEAKIKVARQFALQTSLPSQVINNAPNEDEVSSPVEELSESSTTSLIDTIESNNPKDNSLMATPRKFFKFISNFFTK